MPEIIDLPAIRGVLGYPASYGFRYEEKANGPVDMRGWRVRFEVHRGQTVLARWEEEGKQDGVVSLEFSPDDLARFKGQNLALFIHADAPALELSEVFRAAIFIEEARL